MERSILRKLPPELYLMLFRELSNTELEILIRTCKAMMMLAEAYLYRRDARERNSRALLWAIALSGCSGMRQTQGFQILDKLERYAKHGRYEIGINAEYRQIDGGRIVASAYPLHFAAALGSVRATKRLLQLGALPEVWGFNMNKFISRSLRQCLGRPRRSQLEEMDFTDFQFNRCSISPLAYAFSRDYEAMIQLFLHAAHDFNLVEKLEELPSPPRQWSHAATTLHRIASRRRLGKFMAAELETYAVHVNRTIFDRAPLHLAVTSRNLQAFKALLACDDIDLDVQTYLGRTPLLVATYSFWLATKKGHREQYRDMAIQLIDKGADVNARVGGMVDETPLISAIKSAQGDSEDFLEDAWPLVEHLLRNGAQLNDVTPQGTSAMQLIFTEFLVTATPKPFGLKLKKVIEEFGGDVNIPLVPIAIPQLTEVQGQIRNVSMLGCCCLWRPIQPRAKFGEYLAGRGARFNDQETLEVLRRWLKDEKFRAIKWLPMVSCGQRISEQLAFETYRDVLHTAQDAKLAQQLLKWLPWPKAANDLVRDIAFSLGFETSIRNLVLKPRCANRCEDGDVEGTAAIPFDATGLNLLHEIVNKLRHNLSYTESAAAQEAELFISRGATTFLNEDRATRHFPKSSVDWLQQLSGARNGKLTKVLDVFRRARDKEEGRVMEDCSAFV